MKRINLPSREALKIDRRITQSHLRKRAWIKADDAFNDLEYADLETEPCLIVTIELISLKKSGWR